jgi:hypothetical protein
MYHAFRNYSSTYKLSDWELNVMQASGGIPIKEDAAACQFLGYHRYRIMVTIYEATCRSWE